jgi:hypothetical protein
MAVELFFILFFGLGRLLDPENKIKKAGTDSPTRSCEEERRSKPGARPNKNLGLSENYTKSLVFKLKIFDKTKKPFQWCETVFLFEAFLF